jgi:hypothetical protein
MFQFGGIRRCPTGYLHNINTNRYHPVSFMLSPLPGGLASNIRWKTIGHSTEGFDTLDLARESVHKEARFLEIPAVWDWDGAVETAAMSILLPEEIYEKATKGDEVASSVSEAFQANKSELTNEQLLHHLDQERQKFSTADEDLIKAMIDELIAREVYPKETVPGNPNTVHQMVAGWGAYWYQWNGRFTCPCCGADLRNKVTGPPFLTGDPNVGSCRNCASRQCGTGAGT